MAGPEQLVETRAGTGRPQRAAKAAAVAPLAADRVPELQHAIRTLENRLSAQAWDIKGLTAQRDEAYENLAGLKSEHAALREELLTTTRIRAGELQDHDNHRRDRDTGYALSRRLRQEAIEAAAKLIRAEPQVAAAAAAEAMLIRLSGLFDEAFYRAQRDNDPEAVQDAALHYVTTGEQEGRPPNRLFGPDTYRDEAQRAGLAVENTSFATALAHYAAIGVPNRVPANYLIDAAYCLSQTDGEAADGFDPLLFYLRIGRLRGASPHPLFDVAHYRALRGDALGPEDDPVADYLDHGHRLGLSPHPLFDRGYYLEHYPDIRAAGVDPYLHYVQYGDHEGRQPNPLFDPIFYRERNRAQMPEDGLALAHYVLQGVRQGLPTHVLFDTGHYLRSYPDIRDSGIEPLHHFLENGCFERRSPHPLFDTRYLLDHAPEITKHHPNAVIAFLGSNQRFTASPTPFFDVRFYIAQSPEAAEWPEGPFMHYLRIGSGKRLDPHPLFMTRYYLERLAAAGLDDGMDEPLTHYLLTPPGRTVSPHPLFDQDYYLAAYSDVSAGGGNPLVHFVMSGGLLNEKRQPHPLFDVVFYAKEYRDDLRPADNLLLDYLQHGLARGRLPHRLFDPAWYLRPRDDDPLLHENALVDYLLKGRAAKRDPHPLFDQEFYARTVDVPADWDRTLLEHFCVHSLRVQKLPHPSMDTPYVLERLPHIADLGVNLLDFFLQRAVSESIDPHAIFDTRSYLIRYPEAAAARINPLAHHVMRGGVAWWRGEGVEAASPGLGTAHDAGARPRRGRRSAPAALPAPTGRHPLPGRRLTLSKEFRAYLDASDHRVFGADPIEAMPAKIALFATYVTEGALASPHEATLAALRAAGYFLVAINSTLAASDRFAAAALPQVDTLICRSPGGRDIASWVLASALFYDALTEAEHVLFMNDSYIGPFDDLAPLWAHLSASDSPWWGATDSGEGSYHVQTALFALKRAVLRSAAFERFVADYRFPTRRYDIVQQGELGISKALLEGGFTPAVLASMEELRAIWLDGVPTKLEWFEALPDRVAELRLGGQMDAKIARSLSRYARDWYLDMTSILALGDQINPTLLLWEGLLERYRFPFVKRDLVLFNPPKTPEIVRLKHLAGGGEPAAWQRLAGLLAPVLPFYPGEIHPVLRITREYLQD